jgi:hypothetical protein
MIEFPQTMSNLTEASTNLYELIKGRDLSRYFDNEIRLAMNPAVALEVTRGSRSRRKECRTKSMSFSRSRWRRGWHCN